MENPVLGRCRLVRKLGEGGMGEVWLARHETLAKDVAVKILPRGIAAEPEAVQRFLREARSAARLEHPNVVQVLDAGSADGVHFIVMQYVDGTDLQRIVDKRGKLSAGDALAAARKVAQALGAAHRLGIIHRDIKPANVLVTRQGRVMVTDFGLARDVGGGGTVTASDQVMGTPQYLSPEQALAEPLDGRSDLYSLGGTLYTLLTGRPPYQGPSPVSVALKHTRPEERPEPIRKFVPDVSADVEALVEKLMAKKPADRFQTAEEAVAAIDRIRAGKSTLVTVSEDKVLTPQRRRRLLLRGAGAGVAGLFLLVLFLVLVGPSKAERAYRGAAAARTEEERLLRLREVVDQHPGTKWAAKAADEVRLTRKLMLDRDLAEVKISSAETDAGFRDAVARLDQARQRFPEGEDAVRRREDALHRARLVLRTREFADRLRSSRPGDLDRIKDLMPPAEVRKHGEGAVVFWIRVFAGFLTELGGRVEEAEILKDELVLNRRESATVPGKVTLFNRKKNERTTQRVTIHWVWIDGDWYLGENPIRAEK
jgi:predicted Ser/Thr protein kinase